MKVVLSMLLLVHLKTHSAVMSEFIACTFQDSTEPDILKSFKIHSCFINLVWLNAGWSFNEYSLNQSVHYLSAAQSDVTNLNRYLMQINFITV